jgi:hypothetical protein
MKMENQSKKICCLCNKEFTGWGNNPSPLKEQGECCSVCDQTKVIPARLNELQKKGEIC